MIAEFFINIGFMIAQGFFSMLPDFEWSVDSSVWSGAKNILSMICYLLPLNTIVDIISLIISIAMIRITIMFITKIIGIIGSFF